LPKKIKGTCLRNLWNTGEHTPLEWYCVMPRARNSRCSFHTRGSC
jgi:hypothetical protein